MYMQEEKETLVLQYMPLVEKVVNGLKVKSRDYERGDLVNLGFLGLLDAWEKYDEEKAVPFEKYAAIRIRGAILDEVRKTSHIPRSAMDRLKAYYKAKEDLEKRLKREPTEKEIAQDMGLSAKQLDEIYDVVHQLSSVSLEKVIFQDEGSGVELRDLLPDSNSPQSEDLLLEQERKEYLQRAIATLTEREQQILQLYYVEQLSLKEIAYIYQISVPRVSQIHGKLILKLRDCFRREYDD